jgi:transposase-like protein
LEFVEGSEQGPVLEDAAGRGTQLAVGELGFSAGGRFAPEGVPDPELARKASRRRFTAKYKLSIVREADGCKGPGEIGALLRREGLYSSHLGKWRTQRDAGALGGLEPKPRGPRPASGEAVELTRLRGELDRSRSDLQTARRVIEVQGNVYALLQELLAKSATGIDDGTRQR